MFKKVLTSVAVVAAFAAAAPAQASLTTALNGYSGPIFFDIAGVDQGTVYSTGAADAAAADAAVGVSAIGAAGAKNASEDSWGIFRVKAIYADAAQTITLWQAGSGDYLVGSFGGLVDQLVTVAGTKQTTYSSGGSLSLYEVSSLTNYTAAIAAGAAGRTAGVVAGVDGVGTLVLSAAFSGTAEVGFTGNYTNEFTFGKNIVSGTGYFQVTGGTAADYFKDGAVFDAANDPQDLSLSTTNNAALASSTAGWLTTFNGTVVGYDIPEPGSVALAGLALVGLAAARRRKLV